jgi:hypothetical protein
MYPIVSVLTFDGGGAKKLALTDGQGNVIFHVTKIYAEPASGNTHVAYVGDASLAIGTSTDAHVIKRLAPPTSATATLDFWREETQFDKNILDSRQFAFDGTSGEKIRVTVEVA